MSGEDDSPFKGDFDQIIKRRVLRVLLRNNAASYFLYRGELMGFEYELAQEFARYHSLRLEVVVPPSHRELSSWLLEGKADIAMGFLEPIDSQRQLGIEYSRPYHYARRHIVVKSAFAVAEEIPHAIAMRARNTALRTALDAFIKRTYKSEFYNVLYKKYFKSRRSVAKRVRGQVIDSLKGQISPYDKLVQKYADEYGFDWRLIAAQMFQESRFNPKARSLSGARGLMQLMPRTARSLGVKNIEKPDNSIMAGIKYMDWLSDRFSDELSISERLWFSLAAYNAGVGHVHDARRLAKSIGRDPNRWFSHTETAMLLLSQKKYASQARYRFVNGEEPVNYVRDIKQRFEAYVELGGGSIRSQQDAFMAGATVDN